MTSPALDRRHFIRTGLVAAGAVALGSRFWERAYAAPARPGRSPYGELLPADANGIMLPAGFRSRIVARSLEPVARTLYPWHLFPDGQATYSAGDGGWILVSNSEVPLPGGGGASAIRFNRSGGIESAYRVLSGTQTNCAGGPTPWGTWLSCEEHEEGLVWECDPSGRTAAVARPAMGAFPHEAAAVDPRGKAVYLTEDVPDGRFYRFRPSAYPDLAEGVLEAAAVGKNGMVRWLAVPDPTAASAPTRAQVPSSTAFDGGEGAWYDSGTVYFTTKGDNRVWTYDTRAQQIAVLYDAADHADPPLTGVDNVVVARSGDLLVAEDGGNMEINLITPERVVAPLLRVVGHDQSEVTGPVFDPSGTRLYFGSQRGPGPIGPGVTFEVSGPFRATAA